MLTGPVILMGIPSPLPNPTKPSSRISPKTESCGEEGELGKFRKSSPYISARFLRPVYIALWSRRRPRGFQPPRWALIAPIVDNAVGQVAFSMAGFSRCGPAAVVVTTAELSRPRNYLDPSTRGRLTFAKLPDCTQRAWLPQRTVGSWWARREERIHRMNQVPPLIIARATATEWPENPSRSIGPLEYF